MESQDVPTSDVIDLAKGADLSMVFVLGTHADGSLFAAGSTSSVGRVLDLWEQFKDAAGIRTSEDVASRIGGKGAR